MKYRSKINSNKTLITAIDWSGSKEYPKNIYTLVSIEEKYYSRLKNILVNKLSIRHWKNSQS